MTSDNNCTPHYYQPPKVQSGEERLVRTDQLAASEIVSRPWLKIVIS